MSTRSHPAPRAARPRRGSTLVEMLVAMMIISVGILGLSSGAMLVTRLMGGGARQALVANTVQAHLEKLRASSCASLTGGQDTVRGVITRWTVTSVTRGVDVAVTAQYALAGGRAGTLHTQSYKTIFPC